MKGSLEGFDAIQITSFPAKVRFSKVEILVGPLECPIIRVATGFRGMGEWEKTTYEVLRIFFGLER